MREGWHVVWFKRDLRIQDHGALAAAAARGRVLPLYVVEPELWRCLDMSGRQWAFVAECLTSLQADLAACGAPLVIRVGDVVDVLHDLHADQHIAGLWSHEETGNDWTYRRDLRVADWCRDTGIDWQEVRNHGVRRRQASRDGWSKAWDAQMAQPMAGAPRLAPHGLDAGGIPSARDLGLAVDTCAERQTGGRQAAEERLQSFLTRRGIHYRREMSSPVAGETACSRLSPHLAWGTLSMREAAQATWARQRTLKAGPQSAPRGWKGALSSFNGRLHWHCHFIQKLEDEPRIEYENLHRGFDGIRPSAPDRDRLEAWGKGETGLPFVDACMRYLNATGWLNFRMRAMVMSTAAYHLWLDWRAPGQVLARRFTDYEPGIHWSQVQMQSGTTGINAVRIYNPVKQGYDQDPTGVFTRKWVPELAQIPDQFLQEPWKAENAGQVLGRAYPAPIIDHLEAAKAARDRVWAVRRGEGFRAPAADILARHGSRKNRPRKRGQRAKGGVSAQMELPFGEAKI